jgi:hypothetical protein
MTLFWTGTEVALTAIDGSQCVADFFHAFKVQEYDVDAWHDHSPIKPAWLYALLALI